MPRMVIKGQTLADFVVEFIYPTTILSGPIDKLSTLVEHKKDDEPTNPNSLWSLRIDGSSNMNGSGTDVILDSQIGENISYALGLKFPASNNEAEYKAVLGKIRLVKKIRAEQLKIYSDSQLVVNQVNGDH